MLYEHGHLTTPQLVRLEFASLRMTQARLRALHTLQVTDRFRPFTTHGSHPLHHTLGPAGARVIAAEEGIDLTDLGWRHDRALAAAHRHTLAHDTATHDLICRLATTPDITLTRWWSPTRCARYFGHHTRPDAYLALTHHNQHNPPNRRPADPLRSRGAPRLHEHHGPANESTRGWSGAWWEAFVEYDTGTEALAVLAAKLHGYHSLATATGIATPLLIWTARPGREPRARAALAHTLHTLPHPELVPIATGTPTTTTGHGADQLGRAWLPLTTPTHPIHAADTSAARRLTLAELAATLRAQPPHTNGPPHHLVDPLDPRRHLTYPAKPIQELNAPEAGFELPAPPPLPPRYTPIRIARSQGARRW